MSFLSLLTSALLLKNYIDKREKIISQLVDNCETLIVVAKKSSMFYTSIKHFV
jgi:hypothetical protein